MKKLILKNGLYHYQNHNSDSQGLDLSKWLKKELTRLNVPYTDSCCPANMFYVGYVDYWDETLGGVFKQTSTVTCTESNSTDTSAITLNSLKVNGVEFVTTPVVNSIRNSIQDTLALYNSLGIPGATFKVVSAVNYLGLTEPNVNTTKKANVFWIVMTVPSNVTSVEVSGIFSDINSSVPTLVTNIINQKAKEEEFFDQSTC